MTGTFVPSFMNQNQQKEDKPNSYLPQIPITVDSLPSRSLPYPPGTKIHYRPYTFGEVKQISQVKTIPDEDKFDFVLKGITSNIDVESITISDLLYIGVLRKLSTFGATQANVITKCGCGNRIAHKIEINSLEFTDIRAPELPVYADLASGQTLEFMPLTVAGYRKIVLSNKLEDEIAWFAAQVQNHSFEEAYNIIFNASPLDKEILDEVDEVLFHGLAPIKVQCPKCQTAHKVELDEGEALIVPFRIDEGTSGTRVRYGKRTSHQSNSSQSNGLR